MSDISIFSDGTSRGTVVTTESGEKIDNVTDASITISSQYETEVSLTLRPTSINTTGKIVDVSFHCPKCSEDFEHQCGEAVDGSGGGVQASTPVAPLQQPGQSLTSTSNTCTAVLIRKYDSDLACAIVQGFTHHVHFDIEKFLLWNSDGQVRRVPL